MTEIQGQQGTDRSDGRIGRRGPGRAIHLSWVNVRFPWMSTFRDSPCVEARELRVYGACMGGLVAMIGDEDGIGTGHWGGISEVPSVGEISFEISSVALAN